MSHIATKCPSQSRMFPVEWPLTSKTVATSSNKHKRNKKRKSHRNRLVTKQQRMRTGHAVTMEQATQTEMGKRQNNTHVMEDGETETSCVGVRNDVICEPAVPCEAEGNIFQSLNEDEATWLADEVHQANKNVFEVEKTAEKLKKNEVDLEEKKESFNALKNLLKDLHWNVKYPDEETAKDLDTLDDASNNFGVRNMVNYLGLLDGYFSQLETQLNK